MHLDLPVFNTVEEAMKAVQVKTLFLEFLSDDRVSFWKIDSVDAVNPTFPPSLMPL